MSGRVGPVIDLGDENAQVNNDGPLVAVGEDGTAAVVWVQGKRRLRIRLSVAPPGGRFGTPETIHLRSALSGAPGVTTAARSFAGRPDGSALMLLTESDPPRVHAVSIAPGAASVAASVDVPVAPYVGGTEEIIRTTSGPFIALPGDGSLGAVWEISRALNGDNDDEIVAGRILAASATPSGSFGPPQRLSRPGRTAEDPQIAAVGDTTVAVWRECVGALNPPFSANFAARRGGKARFGPSRRFPADGWIFPELNAAGRNLVASWYPFNGYRAHRERLMLALWREP